MQLTVDQAMDLTIDVLTRYGMSEEHARMVGDHLIDAALCGYEFASLPRIFAVVEQLKQKPAASPIRVTKEDEKSAMIDGGDNVAYVVSLIAIDKAIEICKKNQFAVVGANNTWFGGRLAYYVERAAQEGFIALHLANTTKMVAPYGGIDKVLGTNPFAMAVPSADGPVVVDFGTSATTWGELLLRQRTETEVPDGWAVDSEGNPTNDATEALAGAILPWSDHKGYGLSILAQALGILAGSKVVPDEVGEFGLFFLVFDPELLMPLDQFKERMGDLRKEIKASRRMEGFDEIRLPGEGSQKRRAGNMEKKIYVDDKVYEGLLRL